MHYTIDADEEFLRVKVSGRVADAPPFQVCVAILSESKKLGLNRILIELDQKTPLSPTSQLALVTRLPEIGFTHQHRIALVHRAPDMQKAGEFIDTVAGNRGLNLRNFPSVEDATAWLREEIVPRA